MHMRTTRSNGVVDSLAMDVALQQQRLMSPTRENRDNQTGPRVDEVVEMTLVEGKDITVDTACWMTVSVRQIEVFRTVLADPPNPFWNSYDTVPLLPNTREISITLWRKLQKPKNKYLLSVVDGQESKRSPKLSMRGSPRLRSSSASRTAFNSVESQEKELENTKSLLKQMQAVYGQGQSVGKVSLFIDTANVDEREKEHEVWLNLNLAVKEESISGYVELQTNLVVSQDRTERNLIVHLKKGINLASKDPNGLSDPYPVLVMLPLCEHSEVMRGTTHMGTLNPQFSESFLFKLPLNPKDDPEGLYLAIWDWDRFSKSDFMGETLIPMKELLAISGEERVSLYGLSPKIHITSVQSGDNEEAHDFVTTKKMTLDKCMVCSSSFRLTHTIVKCKACKIIIHGHCQAFVINNCLKTSYRDDLKARFPDLNRKARSYDIHVRFYHEHLLERLRMCGERQRIVPQKHDFSDTTLASNNKCCVCQKQAVRMSKCSGCGVAAHEECSNRISFNCGTAGRIRVKYKYSREIIHAKDVYVPFYNALCTNNFCVLRYLNLKVTQQREAFSKALMRVFIKQKNTQRIIKGLVVDEIANTPDMKIVFRHNSLTTKSIDYSMKVFGHEYLAQVLCPVIYHVCKSDANRCEMDPTRVNAEQKYSEEETNQLVDQNFRTLREICTALLARIYATKRKIPAQIRLTMQVIRESVLAESETRGIDPMKDDVTYVSLTAFLFLRFFCPALLNPSLFNLLDEPPEPSAARDMTLLAKTIQTLANMSSFSNKESFMLPMNEFLQAERPKMRQYLDFVSSPMDEDSKAVAIPEPYLDDSIDLPKELVRVHRHLRHVQPLMQSHLDEISTENEHEDCDGFRNVIKQVDYITELNLAEEKTVS